tara:strand:- start:158 stop:454 length:297 start_codon:yes stop_codon:yes gene_type:complete
LESGRGANVLNVRTRTQSNLFDNIEEEEVARKLQEEEEMKKKVDDALLEFKVGERGGCERSEPETLTLVVAGNKSIRVDANMAEGEARNVCGEEKDGG